VRAAIAIATAGAALIAGVPASGAQRQVTSGQLRATIATSPWHLAFEQAGGRRLSEANGTGTGPTGTIGFSAGGVWHHATRVMAERPASGAYEADLTTTDPLRRLRLRVEPAGGGILRVRATVTGAATGDVDHVGVAFDLPAGERQLGFGERANAVDQRGNTVENYVSDGPYQTEERPFIAGFVPPPGFHPRDDATYFPMPWLLSTRGYGFLLDGADTSNFRLGTDQPRAWSAEVEGAAISFRVFAGPRPPGALRRMSAALGRQPRAAAPFFFGPWFQPASDDQGQDIDRLRRADAPASLANTYTHYLPCGAQQAAEERKRTALFHGAGLAVTTYFNPMICTDYQPVWDQAVAAGVVTKDALGRPYTYKYTGSTVFLVGQMDFTAPRAQAFWNRLLGAAVHDGYDGWMEDFGEYTPPDARSTDGTPGPRMHNLYPVLYHRDAHRYSLTAPRPLARFNRSGWTGAARHSQIVWGGDPTTSWGFDGLRSAVYGGLTMGLSGVSLWGSDIGGFFSLGENQLTPELLARWIQVGMASGVMRTEANGFDLPPKDRPQIFDPGVLPIWRRYAKLRTQLYPYLSAADASYQRTGMPIMRHLALARPDDPRAAARDDEYMFGPDLLAAPVLEPGATTRSLYLPGGTWVDLWRSASFQARDGSLRLRAPRLLGGGRNVVLPAPLAELPLLVRVGAILPLLPPDVDTLSAYGSGKGLVHLSDRRGQLRLLAFPRGTSSASAGTGQQLESAEGSARWTLHVSAKRRIRYGVQASLRTLRTPFTPCSVSVGGRTLPRRKWWFNAGTGVLRVRFTTKDGRLVVRGRCP
jgi:alpha-glucosidase (family GH31 glycosyl hydrolase)